MSKEKPWVKELDRFCRELISRGWSAYISSSNLFVVAHKQDNHRESVYHADNYTYYEIIITVCFDDNKKHYFNWTHVKNWRNKTQGVFDDVDAALAYIGMMEE